MRTPHLVFTALAVALALSAKPVLADGTYPCNEIDVRIQLHLEAAAARSKDFDTYNKKEPTLWDSLKDTFDIWNPIPTDLDGVIEGEIEDMAEKACRGGLKHVLGGIDMTRKLLEQTQVFIKSQGRGVLNAMANAAKKDVNRNLKEAQEHLDWKRKHCNCEDTQGDTGTVGQPDPGLGDGIIDKPAGDGGLVAGDFSGGGFGTVVLRGNGHSLTGTYTGTYNRSQLGNVSITYNPATGQYTGEWSEPAIGRSGVLENIQVSDDGRLITGTWRTTVAGNGYSHASGSFRFVQR